MNKSILTRRDLIRMAMAGASSLLLARLGALAGPTTAPAAARRVRADGVIQIDDKPFFPLGIYHDSLDADYYGQPFLKDLATIADAGFNLAHVSMDFTHDGDDAGSSTAGQAARLAADKHMYLAMSVYLKNLPVVVAEQAKWPAILMASVGDDFNTDAKGGFTGPAKYPPARLRELARQVQAIAPNLLTYSSGSAYTKASLKDYEETVDCIGIQCYPVGDGSQPKRNELEATDDVFANYWALAGERANRCVIANLQSFSWDEKRWISAAEARLQAWTALLNGVRGVMWYSYLTGKTKKPLPESSPALWGELKLLVGEVKQVQALLTEGKLRRIPNPADKSFDGRDGTWHAAMWELGAKRLIVVLNTHRTKGVDVDIEVGGDGEVAPVFEGGRYAGSLQMRGGRLQGEIGHGGVAVYG